MIQAVNKFYPFLESRGLYAQAEGYLKQAQAFATSLADKAGSVSVLLNLGRVAEKRGDYAQAEAYFQEGLELARQVGHRLLIATILHNRGELHLKMSKRDAASKDLSEALKTAPKESQDLRAGILFGLAQIEATLGNFNEARRQGEISLATFEKGGHKQASEVREWLATLPLSDDVVE